MPRLWHRLRHMFYNTPFKLKWKKRVRVVGVIVYSTITLPGFHGILNTGRCTVVVNEKPSKDGLLALVKEAETKYNSDTKYSANSRKTLEDLCDTIMSKIGTMTTEEIQQAEEKLRTDMENLVAIYKVSVPNDNKIELTSDKV